MKKDSRVKAVISLDAVEHNFREMRKNIAEETRMIAVIIIFLCYFFMLISANCFTDLLPQNEYSILVFPAENR